MIPVIMNTNFVRIAEIDNYISFIWASRYYTHGEFELCVPIDDNSMTIFQKNFYVCRNDDDQVGIIERIKIEQNEDEQQMIIVSGRFLTSILSRRIIAVQTQLYGTPSSCIETLINQNAISPAISARTIPNLIFENDSSVSSIMQAQFTGDNLFEAISKICQTYGIGIKMILTDQYKFKIILFDGEDHSFAQSVNPYIIFSDTYDNLLSSEYEESYQNLITDVLIAGEGEGLDRKTLWVSNTSPSGLNRYEFYQDARNTSTNDGEIDEPTYYNQLRGEALESITTFTSAFSGEVDFSNIIFREDLNVGDICTIKNSYWGLSINTRLVEVIESMDESGAFTITPSFGI